MPTVREVIEEFCLHRKSHYSERSFAERRRVLDKFIRDLGHLEIEQCRPIDLDRWILNQTGWKSPATRRNNWALIQAVFGWAGRNRFVSHNPFAGGDAPPEGEPRPPVTDVFLLSLLRHTSPEFRRLLIMLRFSSLREGEVCYLTWPDVNLENGIVTIQRHKTRKKTRRAKIVPLTIPAHKLILWLRRHSTGEAFVFLNSKSRPWTRTNISNRMQALRQRAGVPDWVKPHGLRHQIATEAIARNAPLKLVSQGLGHSQTAVTERFYVQLADQHLEAVRSALGQGAHIRVEKKEHRSQDQTRLRSQREQFPLKAFFPSNHQ